MTIYLVIPLLVAVALLQSTVVARFKIWGVFPDLPLLVVVGWALLRGRREGLLWGFIAGVSVDLFSGAPFGAATLPMMAVAFLAGLGEAHIFRNPVFPVVVVVVATLAYDLGFLAVMQVSGIRVEWAQSLLFLILPSALLNALCAPVIIGGMRGVYRRVRPEPVGL
jgi:rod shape-determining protein MreD